MVASKFEPPPRIPTEQEVFADVQSRSVNMDYFKPYFDQVDLPINLASRCVRLHVGQSPEQALIPFAKFIRVQDFLRFGQFPSYDEAQARLIDYRAIPHFRLQPFLSWRGGDDIFDRSPCIFVSHRWLTRAHPDPDGKKFVEIASRLKSLRLRDAYLWIDYCCIPQSQRTDLTSSEQLDLRAGLHTLPSVLKGCDLMILHSDDFMNRLWCFVEIFIWMCQLREVRSTHYNKRWKLIRSIQTSKIVRRSFFGWKTAANQDIEIAVSNLQFRGFHGDTSELRSFHEAIADYCHEIEAMGSYYDYNVNTDLYRQYIPAVVTFLCRLWLLMSPKATTMAQDREICFELISSALQY